MPNLGMIVPNLGMQKVLDTYAYTYYIVYIRLVTEDFRDNPSGNSTHSLVR